MVFSLASLRARSAAYLIWLARVEQDKLLGACETPGDLDVAKARDVLRLAPPLPQKHPARVSGTSFVFDVA